MKKYLFIIALLVSQSLFARLEFETKKSIIMTGTNCEELQQHATDILRWSQTQGESLKKEIPDCYCSSEKCQIDVYDISPRFVQKYQDLSSNFSGPNCFNAALVLADLLPHISYTHSTEITDLMNSPLCHQKELDEPLNPGDIIAVRSLKNEYYEIHAAIYINDQLSFSKYGVSQFMPYSLGEDVFSSYGVDQQCLRLNGDPEPDSYCADKIFANYYSCISFDQYIETLTSTVHPQIIKIYKALLPVDLAAEEFLMGEMTYLSEEELSHAQSIIATLAYHTKELQKLPLDAENAFLARSLYNRIISLFIQSLYIADESYKKELVRPLKDIPILDDYL